MDLSEFLILNIPLMTESKKSFVLYKSWLNDIEKLTTKQAGILFVNIFRYVNKKDIEYMDDQTNSLYLKIINQIEYEWSKYNPKTKKYHWNYKGGITEPNKIIRNSTKYKIWRKKVFERDDYTCQKCNSFGKTINAHHIKPFSTHKNLRTALSNGVTLCVECHKKEHKL